MSLYSDYIKELRGDHCLEDEHGFATYRYVDNFCYIVDIYVVPEKRKDKIASKYADKIAEIAKAKGCTHIYGSVDVTQKDPTRSLKVLLYYGFEYAFTEGNGIYFKKGLDNE